MKDGTHGKEGGQKIESTTKYTIKENQTLYAHWIEKTYISDSLVLHYDAINNTGNGHSDLETTWKDLSGNGNDGILNGGTWENNCLLLDGIDDWVNCGIRDYENPTIEIVMSHSRDYFSQIACNIQSGGYGLLNYFSASDSIKYNGMQVFINNIGYDQCYSNKPIILNKIYSLSGSFDGNNIVLYENGIKYSKDSAGTIRNTNNSTIFAIGGNPAGTTVDSELLGGKIYSIRLYNRALTDEEVKNNYEIDKAKYGI